MALDIADFKVETLLMIEPFIHSANPMVAKISEDLSDDETGDVGSATTLYESF